MKRFITHTHVYYQDLWNELVSRVSRHELGTLAHVYERVLGYVIGAQGMLIKGYCGKINWLAFFFAHNSSVLPNIGFFAESNA